MADDIEYVLFSPEPEGSEDILENAKDKQSAFRRIQALLSEWLRMENIVVLTAAGCSYEAKGPLMSGSDRNLEDLVLDAVEKVKGLNQFGKDVIAERKNSKTEKSIGFEGWLSYIFGIPDLIKENSPIQKISWKGDSGTDGDIEQLQSLIEKAIFAECALELDEENLSESAHIAFLGKLIARDKTLGRTHLFTLNYDTLFEQALEELGIQYFDGFSGKFNASFDPSVYGLDIYYPGDIAEGKVRRFDKFLQYYKLHGSIHWHVDGSGKFRSRHRKLRFAKEYREKSPNQKSQTLVGDDLKDIEEFGILPTSQKFMQTLEAPYTHLFRLFHSRLNQPQTFLLVLGYGYGDEHVNRLIETALSNPSLVMLFVTPDSKSDAVKRIRKYQDLGQRVFILSAKVASPPYEKATFGDFAKNIMPDVKWLDDYKNMIKFESEIKKMQDQDKEGWWKKQKARIKK